MLELRLLDSFTMDQAEDLERESKDSRPEGIYDLIFDLANKSKARSYDRARIYYLAYLLATKGIELELVAVEE